MKNLNLANHGNILDTSTPVGALLANLLLGAVAPEPVEALTVDLQDQIAAHLAAPDVFPMPRGITVLKKAPGAFPGTFDVTVLLPDSGESSFCWESGVVETTNVPAHTKTYK